MPHYIEAGDLGPEHIGQPIGYDGDDATIYGGRRPHPDGQPGHFLFSLDGREVAGWDIDYVWIE